MSAETSSSAVQLGVLPAGEVTFLFTDIEGSTRLFRALGDGYAELLDAHAAIVRDAVTAHGGVVVRMEGDAFFCAFEQAGPAVAAALTAQLGLARYPWPSDSVFRVRMGLHTGEARPSADGTDYVSLAVHQAARVADVANGGQVVVTQATRGLAAEHLREGAALVSLGSYRLKDFPDPAPLFEVRHRELEAVGRALRAVPAAAHNIPEQATLFVGRRTALDELARAVRSRRLVTILGAGGVGKTRLAIELVPHVADAFPDGVWLIELALLARGAPVAPEVMGALGIPAEPERAAVATVVDALQGRRLLLVLDNCEHVLDSAAELSEQLVAHCPQVSVLATSREPLALAMEQRFPLAPLSVPDGPAGHDPARSEAVALFVDRARAVAPGFDLPADPAPVVEICRRLDGLPLAIELAAARAGALPIASIAERLDRRFALLRRGHRGARAHHETLRASIRWSFELLSEDEQLLFRRLGVFRGEFDLEAAEAVCGHEPLDRDDVLDLLARLVEKSLVQPAGGRYVMLDSIRDFARELIYEEDERESLGAAHLAHYTAVVEASARAADGPEQRAAYDRLDADLGDIRSAVEFALERSDPAALRLGSALGQWGFVRNRLGEVARWCIDAAVAAPDAPPAVRAGALTQAGFAFVVLGSPARGIAMVDDGLALARTVDDRRLLLETLLMAADLRLESGEVVEARPLAREALEVARGVGEAWLLGRAMFVEARADELELGYDETHRRLGRAREYFERAADRRQVGRVLMTMAFLSLEAEALPAADAEAEACVEICGELEHPIGRAVVSTVRIWVAIDRSELDGARLLLGDVFRVACASGYVVLLGLCAAAAAELRWVEGDPVAAARLLGALDANADALGGEGANMVRSRTERLRGLLGGSLGSERLAECLEEGSVVPLAQLAL